MCILLQSFSSTWVVGSQLCCLNLNVLEVCASYPDGKLLSIVSRECIPIKAIFVLLIFQAMFGGYFDFYILYIFIFFLKK